MSATNLFISWSGVTFTPAGGSLISIVNVTDVEFNPEANAERFYGDAARLPKLIAGTEQKRTAKVTTGNAAALAAVAIGTTGTLVAILNDAKNGVTTAGGGVTYTLANAVFLGFPAKGQTNKYASVDAMFEAYSSDGSTDPLTYVAL